MENWHLKSQIFILQASMASIVFSILIGYFIYVQNNMEEERRSSDSVLLGKQLERHTSQILLKYQRKLNQELSRNTNSMDLVSTIYQFQEQHQFQFSASPEQCSKQFRDIYCYGIQGNNQSNTSKFIDLSMQLNAVIDMIPLNSLYFASVSDDQFYCIRPEYPLTGYLPSSRPWYQNHMEQIDEIRYPITEPYFYSKYGIQMTQTTNLSSLNQQLIGIVGVDLNMADLYWNNLDSIKTSLINQQGKIIISQYYKVHNTELLYIYNTSITGINLSQFNEILNMTKQSIYNSNCGYQSNSSYCIIIDGKIQQIIKTLIVMDYIFVLQVDYDKYREQLQLTFDEYDQFNQMLLKLMALYCIGFIVILFIIYFVTNYFIQKPLERLKIITKTDLTRQKQLRYFSNALSNMDWIEKIQLTLINILQRDTNFKQLNPVIAEQNKIQYPRNDLFIQRDPFKYQKIFNIKDQKTIDNLIKQIFKK